MHGAAAAAHLRMVWTKPPTKAESTRTRQRHCATEASAPLTGTAIRAVRQRDRQPPITSMKCDAFFAEFTAWHRHAKCRAPSRRFQFIQFSCGGRRIPALFAGTGQIAATIEGMQIAILGMRLLEIMFFVGLAGSTVVVLISFVEDGKELFGDE